MKNGVIIAMTACVLLSIGAVFILSGLADDAPAGHGFNRTFPAQMALTPVDTLDLEFDSYYIAGSTAYHLYLGNIVAPRHLLAVNLSTLDTQHLSLELDNPENLKFFQLRVKVDSPDFYMSDGSVPAVFKGTLEHRVARHLKGLRAYFLDILPISASAFAIRSVSREKIARIGRMTTNPFALNFPDGLLEKQVDGLFCTDGVLLHDRGTSRLVFVYLYRNQYLVMDTTMALLCRGRTIDTTATAKIAVTSAGSGAYTFSAPPLIVNNHAALYGKYLLINSALQANNEDRSDFKNRSAIDVYDVERARYLTSFSIPAHEGRKLKSFRVIGNRILVLFNRHLVCYTVSEKVLRSSGPSGPRI